MIFSKIKKWIQSLRMYVIADPNDNSVTFSKHLFAHIRRNAKGSAEACVFVFRIPATETFGFMVNPPDLDQPMPSEGKPTLLCSIQHNDKYHCIGFESRQPSVGYILYHYGLPADRQVKLSVTAQRTPQGDSYYQIDSPAW